MAQVMDAQVRQSGFVPEPGPHLHDRCVGLLALLVDEQVGELPFGTQLIQHLQRGVIQWHRPHPLGLGMLR